MATTINQLVTYKTASGTIPGVITETYTLSGGVYTVKNDVAYNNSAVDAADITLLTYQPTKVTKVGKTALGSEGAIVPADVASMVTGTWGVVG